jgi:hypothetical protein
MIDQEVLRDHGRRPWGARAGAESRTSARSQRPQRSPRTVTAASSGSATPEAGAVTPEGMTCPGVRKARLLN